MIYPKFRLDEEVIVIDGNRGTYALARILGAELPQNAKEWLYSTTANPEWRTEEKDLRSLVPHIRNSK